MIISNLVYCAFDIQAVGIIINVFFLFMKPSLGLDSKPSQPIVLINGVGSLPLLTILLPRPGDFRSNILFYFNA